jgi:hypothetical protein
MKGNKEKDSTATTILVIAMGFLALHVLFAWEWAVLVALTVGWTGLLSHRAGSAIERAWTKLTGVLGIVMPSIVLGVLFFLVLYPLSLLSRVFTKDPLMLSSKYDSYFIDVNRTYDKRGMENIW